MRRRLIPFFHSEQTLKTLIFICATVIFLNIKAVFIYHTLWYNFLHIATVLDNEAIEYLEFIRNPSKSFGLTLFDSTKHFLKSSRC